MMRNAKSGKSVGFGKHGLAIHHGLLVAVLLASSPGPSLRETRALIVYERLY